MHRRLIVMRHAKSSWSSEAVTDHERPLNDRGRRDAPNVGVRLVQLRWHPEWVLSSDSLRTRETFGGMLEAFDEEPPVHFTRALYHAGIAEVRREAFLVPDEIQTLLLLGHNPGWEEIVSVLAAEDVILKTASAALLEGPRDSWSGALRGHAGWQLKDVLLARDL